MTVYYLLVLMMVLRMCMQSRGIPEMLDMGAILVPMVMQSRAQVQQQMGQEIQKMLQSRGDSIQVSM